MRYSLPPVDFSPDHKLGRNILGPLSRKIDSKKRVLERRKSRRENLPKVGYFAMVPFALKSWQLISYVSNRAKVGLGRQHRNSPRMRTLAPPPGRRSTRLPLLPAPSIVHGVLAPTRSRQHGCLNRKPGIRNWEMFCWGNDWRYSV